MKGVPKYQGIRLAKGLYLQPHDDGETFSVIACILTPQDPKDKMLWWHGEISQREISRLAADAQSMDDADARYAFEAFCQHGGYDTKREAVMQAVSA